MQEDKELLANDRVTGRTRNSVILRLMEKLILKNASEVAAGLKTKLEGDRVEEIAWKGTNDAKKLKKDDDKMEETKGEEVNGKMEEIRKIEETEMPLKESNITDDIEQKEEVDISTD